MSRFSENPVRVEYMFVTTCTSPCTRRVLVRGEKSCRRNSFFGEHYGYYKLLVIQVCVKIILRLVDLVEETVKT